ncbi:type I restriction-modification system endonuclease [Xenorhabdus cabanillasii]|uniref:Type I restriction enzyme EcoKI R protein n=1 Tax=Xenorhabdus cabanillasii JM26 TaxID=1427517 RepID=W1J780_9GAMM|nr:type I restriction-modification system endonuclease [Xenorhabdus cabanillasii]PHM76102.1 type I restriction-modification system, R subunit [Xenorhabdus cabanillasii JM26]CDL86574.1 Type I restriction enzyme EcoKI R protein [Xenorhabdus cabanillasii JM26]
MKQQSTLPSSVNFGFLSEHDPLFVQIASTAELVFYSDPNTTLIKLRQLGEALAQHIALMAGVDFDEKTSQSDLLYLLNRELKFQPEISNFFHILRTEGNKATHGFHTQHKEALDGLKVARAVAIWFHQTFSREGDAFEASPFLPPADPSYQLRQLQSEIEKLKNELTNANVQLDSNQQYQDLLIRAKAEYEALALEMNKESRLQEMLANQHQQALEQLQQEYEAKLKELQAKLIDQNEQQTQVQRKQLLNKVKKANRNVSLNEELTRILIDQQLNEAGWLTDTQAMKYANGTRPEKNVNKAIAEWPTRHNGKNGRADYVLFCGLTPIAVVEAKRKNTNVAGKITQAERYSKGFSVVPEMAGAWEIEGRTVAWADESDGHYKIPFVYSCNGRPWVKQQAESSGTWFRDVRDCHNIRRSLPQFHTPAGLLDLLKRSKEQAEEKLKKESFDYLKLRDYQQKAVKAVENTLAHNVRTALLEMATGTGKTRTIIGLIYRFLKTERFKRILFLVDRTTLGKQALDAFKEAPLEQNQTLSQIYNIAELGDMAAEAETRVQVATVQSMVSRIFKSDNPPPVDEFDCVIIDEAHRGYTLDQEMTEGEMATRDVAQYLSSYRRVLDYFDAVKVALTATPAKHTTEIFGKAVFTYTYREAVADDWLIDHEPPVRYATKLSQEGIHFDKGEKVQVINIQTGAVEMDQLEDEMDFEVDAFNRRVINDDFNRVICEELVKELDPFGDEKTLIFCANDLHADKVKHQLDKAFSEMYPDYNQAAVEKITGKSDKVDQLISRYKNERYPNIAITVDLLTTGIDVPKICHLVYMRRVKSRILFEQMLGRATRRCDEIGKSTFRIYDPVDIYAALENVTTMKPLVKNPNITSAQLVGELTDSEQLQLALNHPGCRDGETHADVLVNQLSQKLMKILRKAGSKAQLKPELREKLDDLGVLWGIEAITLPQYLRSIGPQKVSIFLQQHRNLLQQLDELSDLLGNQNRPIISEHKDALRERSQGYGDHQRPEDYLDSFNQFIREQINQSAALMAVVNRPRDLTREELTKIRLELDQAGYTEAKLKTAVRNQTNQDIAASIIGYIRQSALGEPLIPFQQRVINAMENIYRSHSWTSVQRTWLDRLAKQLIKEVVIDKDLVNSHFAEMGGVKQLDKILSGKLDNVLNDLCSGIWSSKGA